LILVVIALVVLVAIAASVKRSPGLASANYPYTKCQALFTPAERSFLGVLDQAVGDDYRIFGKIRVADVLEPKRGLDKSARLTAFNRIASKHFDFVLCADDDLSVVAAIELDDASHRRKKRQDRDAFLLSACAAAALPLIQVRAQQSYSVPELRNTMLQALPSRQALPPESQAEAPSPTASDQATPVAEEPPQSEMPTCPKCSAPMVLRRAKTGKNAGRQFWGCSTFPRCRGMLKTRE